MTKKKKLNDYSEETVSLFIKQLNSTRVIKKVNTVVNKIPSKLLKTISSDINEAKELCLLFLQPFNKTYFLNKDMFEGRKIVRLDSSILKDVYGMEYNKIKKVLMTPFKYKGSEIQILFCNNSYKVSTENQIGYSKSYWINDDLAKIGIEDVEIKSEKGLTVLNNKLLNLLARAEENIICRNELLLYKNIEIPTVEEVIARGEQLISEGYTSNKGKILAKYNKTSRDRKKYSYLDENIELFTYYTSTGYLIPRVGSIESGGRIITSFTLLPSWIREMIKINGEAIVNCDFSALHPNICLSIFNGGGSITHEEIAEYLGIDKTKVKREHLSYFNEKVGHMSWYNVHKYYTEKHPKMIENIIKDKKAGNETHAKTFKVEVEMMGTVIERLNNMKIYGMYVYDAIYVTEENAPIVRRIMNEVATEMNIGTSVKGEVETVETEQEKIDSICNETSNNDFSEDFEPEVIETPSKETKSLRELENELDDEAKAELDRLTKKCGDERVSKKKVDLTNIPTSILDMYDEDDFGLYEIRTNFGIMYVNDEIYNYYNNNKKIINREYKHKDACSIEQVYEILIDKFEEDK